MKSRTTALIVVFLVVFMVKSEVLANEPQQVATTVHTWTHSSGIDVILVEDPRTDYFSVNVSIRTGSRGDPVSKSGLANLMAEMLLRGTQTRDHATLFDAFEFLGSDVDIETYPLAVTIAADSLRRNREVFFELLSDLVLHPALAEDQLPLARREVESDILLELDEDRDVAFTFFRRMLFHEQTEGRSPLGTLREVGNISLDDIREFYDRTVVSQNILIGVAGNLSRAELDDMLSRTFADVRPGRGPELEKPHIPSFMGREVTLVDREQRSQTQIVAGHLAPAPSDADIPPLEVVMTALGGGFSSRMMTAIRVEAGLSYGAYAYLLLYPEYSVIRLWTFPTDERTLETLELLLSLYETLRRDGLPEKELAFAKAKLIDGFPRTIATPQDYLYRRMHLRLLALPEDSLESYQARIGAVTSEDVQRVLTQLIDPNNIVIVVLCTAKPFEAAMRALPGVESLEVKRFDEAATSR